VILDVIKRGENDPDVAYPLPGASVPPLPVDKSRNVIVRLYDSLGGKSTGKLKFEKLAVKKVFRANLLEDELSEIVMETPGALNLTVNAFEVVTLKLVLDAADKQ
jgi:alpha-mannosidase